MKFDKLLLKMSIFTIIAASAIYVTVLIIYGFEKSVRFLAITQGVLFLCAGLNQILAVIVNLMNDFDRSDKIFKIAITCLIDAVCLNFPYFITLIVKG